jgi:cytochrome c
MPRKLNIAVILFTMVLYSGAVFIGLQVRNFSFLDVGSGTHLKMRGWVPPHQSNVPEGARGASIRSGSLIVNETPLYASQYTGAKISCANCHAEGGIQVYASPMVGLPRLFPMYNQRAGHVISLRDRIEECFVRSENGKPLSYNGPEMQAIVDYIEWPRLCNTICRRIEWVFYLHRMPLTSPHTFTPSQGPHSIRHSRVSKQTGCPKEVQHG